MPRVRSPYNWTGFYFGADGGFAWQRATGTLTTASGAVLTPYGYSGSGPFAGSFVGGNYQFNRFVLGVEGDWQWSNLTGSNQALAPLGATGALPSGPFTVSTTIKDYGSIRGRLGIAFDRFLVFGTGGWAHGQSFDGFRPDRSCAIRHDRRQIQRLGGRRRHRIRNHRHGSRADRVSIYRSSGFGLRERPGKYC
jgi:outer membrane immunogenic protein